MPSILDSLHPPSLAPATLLGCAGRLALWRGTGIRWIMVATPHPIEDIPWGERRDHTQDPCHVHPRPVAARHKLAALDRFLPGGGLRSDRAGVARRARHCRGGPGAS